MTIAEHLLADFLMEAESTRKVLDAVPAERLDWQPHEKSMSLGRLAGHVAETPSWAPSMMEDEMDFAGVADSWKPFIPAGKTDLMQGFERNVKDFEKLLAGRQDDFMNGTWTARHGDQVVMAMPRHTALRTTLVHHVIHHRGQLTVYLRLLGVPVPGTYGPTADEAAMA